MTDDTDKSYNNFPIFSKIMKLIEFPAKLIEMIGMDKVMEIINDKFLMYCESGNVCEAEKFIKEGVDVNMRNKLYWTPLMVAAERGNKDMVELLIKYNANIDAMSCSGITAKDIAILINNKEIIDLFSQQEQTCREYMKNNNDDNVKFPKGAALARKNRFFRLSRKCSSDVFIHFLKIVDDVGNNTVDDGRDLFGMEMKIIKKIFHDMTCDGVRRTELYNLLVSEFQHSKSTRPFHTDYPTIQDMILDKCFKHEIRMLEILKNHSN